MATSRSDRLNSQDAAFLYFERPKRPMHIGELEIYEGEISFERHAEYIEGRIPLVRPFRQRLAFVPFNLAHPTLEDDPDYDIRNHVKHWTLPAPGTDEQLTARAAKIFEQPLDREKPLWEIHLINGLAGGRTAMMTKVHHCLADGASGIALLMMPLIDTGPEPDPPPDPVPWHPRALPSPSARLRAGLWATFTEQGQLLLSLWNSLLDPRGMFRRARHVVRTYTKTSPWLLRRTPSSPFSGKLGPSRRLAFSKTPFDEIREIRASLGGTVNDVALAILTGALRSYLQAHGRDVNGPELRVAVPVNIRPNNEAIELGNGITSLITPLPIGAADPVERLQAVRERMDMLKKEDQGATMDFVTRLLAFAPAPLQAAAGGTSIATRFFNVGFSNAAAIPISPLYSTGHRMLEVYAVAPLPGDGAGLGITLITYDGTVFWSLTAEPNAMPDLDDFKRMFEQSYADLLEAARARVATASANGHARDGRIRSELAEQIAGS